MVSFDNAHLKQNQSRGVSNLEPLPKPVLDAISQAVVMAMEKYAHSREPKKYLKINKYSFTFCLFLFFYSSIIHI
jgi:hypothetical protein